MDTLNDLLGALNANVASVDSKNALRLATKYFGLDRDHLAAIASLSANQNVILAMFIDGDYVPGINILTPTRARLYVPSQRKVTCDLDIGNPELLYLGLQQNSIYKYKGIGSFLRISFDDVVAKI